MTTLTLPLRSFETALTAAQAGLETRAHGEAEVWVLPNARVTLSVPTRLGATDRHLTLRGSGPRSELVLEAGASLALNGGRIMLDGFALDASGTDASTCAEVDATLSLRLQNVSLTGGSTSVTGLTGLRLNAPDMGLTGVDLRNLSPVAGDVLGISLQGVGRATVENVTISGLQGADVAALTSDSVSAFTGKTITISNITATGQASGLAFTVSNLSLDTVSVEQVQAGAQALGVDLSARDAAGLTQISVRGLRGSGLGGRPFDDLAGDGARGLRLDSPAGTAEGVQVSDLTADTGRAVAIRLPVGFDASGLSVGRGIDGADLVATLAAAQAELADAPAGSLTEYTLPAGSFELETGLSLGQAGRGLSLTGAPRSEGGTTLRFRADGGGAVAGDLDALQLVGTTVVLRDLAVDARATGALRAVVITADGSTSLSDVTLRDPRGASVEALQITQAREVAFNDLHLLGGRATAGDFTGIAVQSQSVISSGLRAEALSATGAVVAVDLLGRATIHLAATTITNLAGDAVAGLVARVAGAVPGAVSVIDLRLNGLDGAASGGAGIGAALICDGDIELRAFALDRLHASRAIGAVVSATGTIDWLAAEITDVLGRTGGATGARVIAAPSAATDDGLPGIALRDLAIRAVRGAAASGQGQPADSWLSAAPTLAASLVDQGLIALPRPGTPGHAEEIIGLAVTAPVSDATDWLGRDDPASVIIESGIFHRISGTVLQLDTALRDVGISGTEAWTGVDAAWIDGERVQIANVTWHRMHRGMDARQSAVTAVNSLITSISNGPGLFVANGGDIAGGATFATLGTAPLMPAPLPLPYVNAGPASVVPPAVVNGALAPAAVINLGLDPATGLHDLAIPIPGEAVDLPVHMGAIPPFVGGCCTFVDPDPQSPQMHVPAPEPSPFADYLGRDARAFLVAMLARADVVMPEWTSRGSADVTTMILELMASELDLRAYRQEEAVANGYIATATQRRALEDNARLVDHTVNKGASAVTMLQFTLTDLAALGLAPGEALDVPARTLAVNPDANDIAVVFATEAALRVDPELEVLTLVEGSMIEPGDLSAELAGDVALKLADRWLVIEGEGPDGTPLPAHVVRVVSATQDTDTTLITWDPRRPAPASYSSSQCRILGNVVPAHHGVPLSPVADDPQAPDPLAAWRDAMRIELLPASGRLRDVTLPASPVSRPGFGWPLPGASDVNNPPMVQAWLDGMAIALTDDLSNDLGAAPLMALRVDREGTPALTLANTGDGGALSLEMSVGLGAIGNVGPHALSRILLFGSDPAFDTLLADQADRLDILTRAIAVTNPIRAVAGRDSDGVETIRAQAPLANRRALSAVAPRDYARRLEALDTVNTARASVVDRGLTQTIRVTVLMTDEDTLTRPDMGQAREAERLRRWAAARRELDAIRLMGFDVELVPPDFVSLDIDLTIDVAPWASAYQVRSAVEAALRDDGGLFDPDTHGLGRDVTPHAIHQTVLGVSGVDAARLLRLRRLAPDAQDFSKAAQMPIGDTEVAVLKRPYGAPDGVLTITTCGGVA